MILCMKGVILTCESSSKYASRYQSLEEFGMSLKVFGFLMISEQVQDFELV